MSDAQSDAWLREARPALEEVLELERNEGAAAARERMEQLRQAYFGLRDLGVDRPLSALGAERQDAQIARTKGVWVLWMLRETLGEQEFTDLWLAAPRAKERVAGLELRAKSQELGAAFLEFWIEGTGLPDYGITAAWARPAGGGFNVTMRIVNRGSGEVMTPAAIRTEEGAKHYLQVTVPVGGIREITYATITRPVAAAIDPEGEVLAAHPRDDWRPIRVRRWWIF